MQCNAIVSGIRNVGTWVVGDKGGHEGRWGRNKRRSDEQASDMAKVNYSLQ